MYVCNCAGIRESEARHAIQCGATRPAQVFNLCGKDPACGKCVPDMHKLIKETQQNTLQASKLAAE